jgi:hypothetical protein
MKGEKGQKKKELGILLPVLVVVSLLFTYFPTQSVEAATPPPYTTTWYMNTSNPSTLSSDAYVMGCNLGYHDSNTPGTQDNVVALLFGQPAYSSGTYGTYVWGSRGGGPYYFLSTSLIANVTQQFARGYYICTGIDSASQLYLAAGVNNYGTGVTNAHGRAWATMINSINSWVITNGYSSQVKIRAAADIEPDFGAVTSAKAWVNGYNANYGSGLWLYNVGAASGCPWTGTPSAYSPCNNGWLVDDVWYVSWGAIPFYVIPEIYNTATANAEQWYRISLYSALYKGGKILFPGTLTQYQACQQMGGCAGIDNSPSQGWTQLFNSTYADPRTSLTNIRWATDIKWR